MREIGRLCGLCDRLGRLGGLRGVDGIHILPHRVVRNRIHTWNSAATREDFRIPYQEHVHNMCETRLGRILDEFLACMPWKVAAFVTSMETLGWAEGDRQAPWSL